MVTPRLAHRVVDIGGVKVFYREAGPSDAPAVLLLHGFPTASHQYRRLMQALGERYRLIAPDYPGFGHTHAPTGFEYTFDNLAGVLEGFIEKLGLHRFVMYAFDFGGPVGFRLAERRPEAIAGLIVQNANAYDEGLSDTARHFIGNATAQDIREHLLVLSATRDQYVHGVSDTASLDPDSWTLDQHFLDLPGRKDAQVSLALDYRNNVALYPRWQTWLREHQPPALIVWGTGDPFFIEAGARAYLRDLPAAHLHLLATGHFALEEKLPEIAELIDDFLSQALAMKIAVIGGTGRLGGAVAEEATQRGHAVTPLGSADLDVTDVDAVRKVAAAHDAVVVSVKGPNGLVPDAAQAVLEAGVRRVLFIGGGGSLQTPSGIRYVDSASFPEQYRQTAVDQAAALEILRGGGAEIAWSYLSPPPLHLVDGGKTGAYRAQARDTPITDENGESRISLGDLAAAAVDALEQGSFVRQRFTAGY